MGYMMKLVLGNKVLNLDDLNVFNHKVIYCNSPNYCKYYKEYLSWHSNDHCKCRRLSATNLISIPCNNRILVICTLWRTNVI